LVTALTVKCDLLLIVTSPSLVIVDDFYIKGIFVFPPETDSIPIIDPNSKLSCGSEWISQKITRVAVTVFDSFTGEWSEALGMRMNILFTQ
jgi:hypothetical protein